MPRLRFLRDARFDYGAVDGVRSSLYAEGDVADVPSLEAAEFLSNGVAELAGEERAEAPAAEQAVKSRTPRKRKEP